MISKEELLGFFLVVCVPYKYLCVAGSKQIKCLLFVFRSIESYFEKYSNLTIFLGFFLGYIQPVSV